MRSTLEADRVKQSIVFYNIYNIINIIIIYVI